MDTASSQPGELLLALPSAEGRPGAEPAPLAEELWAAADAESCGLTREEWSSALAGIGQKHHFGLEPEARAGAAQQAAFYRGLRLPELALAQACALGREPAWKRFVETYRRPLTQAAIAITGSATRGHELADSLYAELYGLGGGRGSEAGERQSPIASYSGRGSLLGWLRTTLAQRHIDHHRRTRRETPLEAIEDTQAAPSPPATAIPAQLGLLTGAVQRTLEALVPEDRFLLASYFLDRQTLLQISRLLRVHEATVSRRLKRLTGDLRKQLLRNLQSGGMSRRAAEEALGADPRDLEINLRALLQSSPSPPFSEQSSIPAQPRIPRTST